MLPALDISRAVCALPVTDGDLNDFQIESGSAKQQIEITKRIKVAKVRAVFCDPLIVGLSQYLCATQRISDSLPQKPRKGQTKELVPNKV